MFSTQNQIIVSPFVHIFDIITLFAAECEDPKISISGEGLKNQIYIISFSLSCSFAFFYFQDTVKVVKQFMARDPDQLNFTLMALIKNS